MVNVEKQRHRAELARQAKEENCIDRIDNRVGYLEEGRIPLLEDRVGYLDDEESNNTTDDGLDSIIVHPKKGDKS